MKKSLKFKFDLNCKFAVYVPSTRNVNETCDNSKILAETLKTLSALFGGATATPAQGAWIAENGETIIEKIDIVYSFCTSEQAAEHFPAVLALCEKIKREMNQEAISLEYNGQLKFV